MAIDKAVDSAALNSMFTSIANAIRAKNGETAQYTPAQMAEAIAAIEAGGGGGVPSNVEYYEITPTETGVITVTEDCEDAVMAVCFLPLQGVGNLNHVNDDKMLAALSIPTKVTAQYKAQLRMNSTYAQQYAQVSIQTSNSAINTSGCSDRNAFVLSFRGNKNTSTQILSLEVYAGGTYGMILGATYHLLLFRSGVNW